LNAEFDPDAGRIELPSSHQRAFNGIGASLIQAQLQLQGFLFGQSQIPGQASRKPAQKGEKLRIRRNFDGNAWFE